MKPNRPLRISGLFFSGIFAIATVLDIATGLIGYFRTGTAPIQLLYALELAPIAALFFISSLYDRLGWIQWVLLLATVPIPVMEEYSSFYGLGLYCAGIIIMYKGGYLERRKRLKIGLLLIYLYGLEIASAINTHGAVEKAIAPVFFISAFLAFMYLMFRDRMIVYLKKELPILSLSAKGLSANESLYVRGVKDGKSQKEIASDAGVSESTVRNTLARAYKKLEVVDKAGLAALLAQHDVRE